MPRLCHAILYDADEKGRAVLAYGFEVDGLAITATGRVDEFERALTSTPVEAAIVVLRDDDDHGLALLRALAENPPHAQLPRLVLADAATLPESVAQLNLPGAQGFLALPAFVRDVVTAAKLLAGGAAAATEASLEGALSDFGLFFVLRTMVALGLSGIVEVDRSSRKGELRFHQGELVSAQVGPHEGPAALHQLLLWEEAALVVRFRATVRRGQEFAQGDELLDDCARFLRDFEHATRSIGHAQSLFVQDAEKTASSVDAVTSELVPVLRLFDGHRNLGDVLEDSPYRAFDTLRTVERLIELKTIRRKAIEKPTTGLGPGRRPRPAQEDWLGRSGDLPVVTTGPAGGGDRAGGPGRVDAGAPSGRIDRLASPTPGSADTSTRGRRSFRRKTGEHAIAPAPAPGSDQPPGPPAVEVRSASIPTLPLPAVPSTPEPTLAPLATTPSTPPPAAVVATPARPVSPPAAAPLPSIILDFATAEPASAPAPPPAAAASSKSDDRPPVAAGTVSPVPGPAAVVRPAAGAPLVRRAQGGIAQVHGELRSDPTEALNRKVVVDVPTMLIDLGPDLGTETDDVATGPAAASVAAGSVAPLSVAPAPAAPSSVASAPAAPTTPARVAPAAAAAPQLLPSPSVESPAPAVKAASTLEVSMQIEPTPPPPTEAAPPPRRLDVHAAEIDTGMRPQPNAALLEAPAGGPSIMIDPRLVEEMDAFELENAAPTPPPALTGAPPKAGPPTGAAGSPPPGGVVSFVRGAAGRPPTASPAFNAVPTVPVAPVVGPSTASAPVAETATAAVAPAAETATATPESAAAAATAPAAPAARHTPAGRGTERERRASGEFDALESEFFARESDLYAKEPVENFDDLDPGKGKTPAR